MNDFASCDLLIVVGTSLSVGPFNSLMHRVPSSCPRLLVNLESVGEIEHARSTVGFDFEGANGKPIRDVRKLAKADDAFEELCELLGWSAELQRIRREGWRALDAADGSNTAEQVEPQAEERQTEVLEAVEAAVDRSSEQASTSSKEVDELAKGVASVELDRTGDRKDNTAASEGAAAPGEDKKAAL